MAWEPLPTGLGTEAALERLVYASLFTDARLDADTLPPDGTNDRRGCWADALEGPGENFGSLLWVRLAGIPTARELEQAVRDALAWMIADGIVSRVEVVASVANRRADVLVDLVLESGRRVPVAFPDLWSSYG
jgi:phage gp46-like protein